MFQVLSEVRWRGVGNTQGLEHGEIVTSDLQSPAESWGRIGGQRGFLFTFNIFLQKSKQFKNKPTASVHVYIFRSG